MKKLFKFLFKSVLIILIFCVGFFIFATVTDFNPEEKINIGEWENHSKIVDSTFTIFTWNIGYGGLGKNMDFFYDGGKLVRDSESNTAQNLKQIGTFIANQNTVDFFLFQEVDVKSKRTYGINEKDSISKYLNSYSSTYTDNFVVNYIPMPIQEHMGSVQSGLLTSSKFRSKSADRYGFPGNYSWPTRVFTLDRCFLVNRFELSNGKDLVIINTHNSAFDDGSLKLQQINYLISFLKEELKEGNEFVVGGDWNQNPPDMSSENFNPTIEGDNFTITEIDKSLFPENWNWNFDHKVPTARSNINPYDKKNSTTTVLDFFLTSPGIKVTSVKNFDLQFENSDHQPVIMTFHLKS